MSKSHDEPLKTPQAKTYEQAYVVDNKLYRYSITDLYKSKAEYLSDELVYIKKCYQEQLDRAEVLADRIEMSVRTLIKIRGIICCPPYPQTAEIQLNDILKEINYFEDWYMKKYNKMALYDQLKAREV